MASIKAKKGNPFEKNTQYSMLEAGYDVTRMDDNSKGIDLYYTIGNNKFYVECKRHKGFTWNELVKIYNHTKEGITDGEVIVIFKANRQPTLVFYRHKQGHFVVVEFKTFYGKEWSKRPKGWSLIHKV